MITLAVAAVLAAVAIPNMRDFIRNNRLTAAGNDMLRSLQVARSEAIKRQQVVAACASGDPMADDPGCSGGAFTGWIVFQDTNNNWERDSGEDVLDRQSVAQGVRVVNNNSGVVSYSPSGFSNSTPGKTPTSRIVICDERGIVQTGTNSLGRAVLIEPAGRARVTKEYATVDLALNTIGGSCP